MPPEMQIRMGHDASYVQRRVERIKALHRNVSAHRTTVHKILGGGRESILALLGSDTKLRDEYLPAANLMHSGMTRLAQLLGHMPDTKVDPPTNRDSDRARDHAEFVENVVQSYDQRSAVEMDLPYIARWLPAYGYAFASVKPMFDPIAEAWYPDLKIRNSIDVYPGWWGADQDPKEAAIIRKVDVTDLKRQYPMFAVAWDTYRSAPEHGGGVGRVWWPGSQWEGDSPDSVTVTEYWDIEGMHLFVDELGTVIDFIPNPLPVKHFHVARRFDFDALAGQYDHMIGLMSLFAKLTILGYIGAEDSVFRETNIIGDMTAASYKRGRNQINRFPPGTQIDRPTADVNLPQTFAQIDRVERMLRTQANYPVSQDAQSPNSFATGQGIDRLLSSADENVKEYQKTIRYMLQELDAVRLMWDEVMYSGESKPLEVHRPSKGAISTTYDPKRIRGSVKTRRVYGVMAGWDDATKIVTGLQLLQGRIIDRRTFQENLHGMENIQLVNQRIIEDEALGAMMRMLEQRGAANDPRASAALAEILQNPDQARSIVLKFFTPEEPELSPEEQQFLASQQGGAPGGPPPDIATVLSRLEAGGGIDAGVQTVGRL